MKTKNHLALLLSGILALGAFLGCANEAPKPPTDRAVIDENVIDGVGGGTYRLVDIDGRRFERERVLTVPDRMPGALVGEGTHEFKVVFSPNNDSARRESTFTATVEVGKRYRIATRNELPALVEETLPPSSKR